MSHTIFLGKIIKKSLKAFHLGSGSTWPGHIALSQDPKFISDILDQNPHLKVVIVAGTNGKTTTSLMIKTVLQKTGHRVFQNESGANLLNGIASTLIQHANVRGSINFDYAIFEVDENALPIVLDQVTPDILVLLNLFRDQLDRYGEINSISHKWMAALNVLYKKKKTTLVLNADDPRIAFLGNTSNGNVSYFGLSSQKNKSASVAADSLFCPQCNSQLKYSSTVYSHLGVWMCPMCKLKRPTPSLETVSFYPLDGTYNKYNTLAAVLTCIELGISKEDAETSLNQFIPAFGRQEIIKVDNKYVQIYLSKNPASFDQSLETIMAKNPKAVLFVLNDRIPDGKDVSWIWDTQIEAYDYTNVTLFATGDRAYDMGVRLKYASQNISQNSTKTILSLPETLTKALLTLKSSETLYILPTYSAMLEVRKILTGRKIL